MALISRNMYIDKIGNIFSNYSNTYHSAIKMKPVDVKSSTNIHSSKKPNDKYSTFKVDDLVRVSKYSYVFPKGFTRDWSEEVFVNKNVTYTVPWTYVTNDLNGEELIGTCYEKKLQKKKKSKRV